MLKPLRAIFALWDRDKPSRRDFGRWLVDLSTLAIKGRGTGILSAPKIGECADKII